MAESLSLALRQAQRLTLAPQLRQSLALLQSNNLELSAQVATEIESNPLLSLDGEEGREPAPERQAGGTPRPPANRPDWARRYGKPAALALGGAGDGRSGSVQPSEGDWRPDEIADIQTLKQRLLSEAALQLRDRAELLLAAEMIDHLDDAGYMTADLGEIAETLGLGVAQAEAVLKTLQALDRPGLFAQSLRQCLALQLADQGLLDATMECLLDNLALLAQGELERLQRLCELDASELRARIKNIQGLEPRPAADAEVLRAQPLLPDLFLTLRPDDSWQITLNGDTLPRVLIDRETYATVRRAARSRKDSEFITDCYRRATALSQAIDRRAETLLAVAAEIVRRQDGFLRATGSNLQGMTLASVAEPLELHISTVSRAIADKTLAAPGGLFPLSYFFGPSLATASGQISAEAVRQKLGLLVGRENPERPLSDQSLVQLLADEGIEIARRTVTKYRKSLKIPSSSVRRRQARLGL